MRVSPAADYSFPADRMRPIAAFLAASRLFRNTQDTSQVALLEIALGGYSQRRLFERFVKCETGQAVIRGRRSLVGALDDHAHLRTLPENSLGRHYLAHMAREGLSVQGLLDALPAVTEHLAGKPEPMRLYLDYAVRCAHDLHHVLGGYGRDELGEACTVAMAHQHLKIRGYKVIYTLAPLPIRKQLRRLKIDPSGVYAAVREAVEIGRQASWFPALDIEAVLAEDLDALRNRLNIRKPVLYNEIIARVRAHSSWENGPWVYVPAPKAGCAAAKAVAG